MTNELAKSDWGYVVPDNTKNYNDFYKGNWKVVNTFDDQIQLSQSNSVRGDGYYTHSKKNIIIPMKQFQRDFKRVRTQDIVVEEKPVCHDEETAERKPAGKTPIAEKSRPVVMTNKDIKKSIDERKASWTDSEIDSYLKDNGLLRNKTRQEKKTASVEITPTEEDGARKTINAFEAVFDDAFGRGATNKLLELFRAGVNWNNIKERCPVGPHRDYPEDYERELFPAVDEFQKAREEFGKLMRFFDPFKSWYPGNPDNKKFEPDRPCRYTQEYTEKPRCESKDCKHCKRGTSIY